MPRLQAAGIIPPRTPDRVSRFLDILRILCQNRRSRGRSGRLRSFGLGRGNGGDGDSLGVFFPSGFTPPPGAHKIPRLSDGPHRFLKPIRLAGKTSCPRGSGVEHFLGKEGVTGSNPVVGSTTPPAIRSLPRSEDP